MFGIGTSTLRNASLHTKLTLALAVLVTLVAGGSAYFLIDRERDRRLVELEQRATRIADLLSRSLALPLWNVDRKAIDSQLAAVSSNPEVARFSVSAVNYGMVTIVPGPQAADPNEGVVRVRPIEHAPFEGFPPQKIGEVRVVLSRAVAERAFAQARTAIVAMTVAVVVALYAATLVLLKRMVRGPINRLEEMVDRIAGGDFDARCVVESGDEIGRLAGRVNAMAERLHESTHRLRDSESKYRGIVENALEGIFQLDRHGRLTEANPAMAHLLGHATPAALMWAVNDHGATRMFSQAQTDSLFETLASEGKVVGLELQLSRADGEPIWVQLNARGVGGNNGDPECLEGLLTDITARKQVMEDLRSRRDQLEQAVAERTAQLVEAKERAEVASRAKSTFLANMSHELRTPLNGILGFAQVLRRTSASDERLSAGLSTIQRCGEHLLTLINDVLDLAKIESGRFDVLPEVVDLGKLLDELHATFLLEAERKKLQLEVERPVALAKVVVDGKRLRQVLMNLVSNALKFTDTGRICLRVERLAAEQSHHARLRFTVRDTGIGIASEDLQRIFKPYEQAGDRLRRGLGTGLGLALSRQLVTQMGGDLRVKSKPMRGSTFCFELSLPLAHDIEADEPAVGTIVTYAGQRTLVLVADDIDVNRSVLCEMLDLYGFEVAQARDGHEVIELALSLRPALVLMDIWMPRVDGLEAMRHLRDRLGTHCMPIIAVSASAGDEERQQARLAGAADFLAKPVMHGELLATLGRHLQLEWVYA